MKLNTYFRNIKNGNFSFLFPLAALVILTIALSQQLFNISPLGKMLDPFIGAVQNDNDHNLNGSTLTINKTGLSAPVRVFFDERKVPHIYAQNTADLYFAQGYVTAGLRLWQMDFLTYASAGRLSEIFPEGFLDYDRTQRRLGLLASAKASLKKIEINPETIEVLTAYTKGVNAYISRLHYKDWPLEYKLLDYAPEPWTNLKTVLSMVYMANVLSGYEEDYSASNMMLALGETKFNKLFPAFTSHITPVMNGEGVANPDSSLAYLKKPGYLDYSFLSSGSLIAESDWNPKLGSNSWVVSGKKTKSGFPILCNDPHLNLTLPCVWLEMQLSSPEQNVYGVTIPGAPAIIIGFNENIAWGITNGADDVKDLYKSKVAQDYSKYEFDGKWLNLPFSTEIIKRKGQQPFTDTIYRTVQGPIFFDKNFPGHNKNLLNYALKWELHTPTNAFLTFIKLNKASNYKEYREAIKSYTCPIQNFTFACKNNDISVDHQGNLPLKWPGEGRFLLDGTNRGHLYTSYIPVDSLPKDFNPDCNYVVSANQHPTTAAYPYYYNGYYSETRANRIQQLLKNDDAFDISKMKAMQLDNTNAFAVDALSVLTACLHKQPLNETQQKALAGLTNWKGTYAVNDEEARLFELWWKNINDIAWDELKRFPFYLRAPENYVLLDLIEKEPENEFFDIQATSLKETAMEVVAGAFDAAIIKYNQLKDSGSVKWGAFNKVTLTHLSRHSALSVKDMPAAGSPEAINAMSAKWGPSWRMIVELGDRPKAYGVYPGGQSGNVGSKYYNNFTNDWLNGHYYPLQFFISKQEAETHATASWILK